MPYKVNWDNGNGGCGTFPQTFDAEAEAQAFADDWAFERNLEDLAMTPEQVEERGGENCYTAEVIEQNDVWLEIPYSTRKEALERARSFREKLATDHIFTVQRIANSRRKGARNWALEIPPTYVGRAKQHFGVWIGKEVVR